MAIEPAQAQVLESVLRALSTATRSLRLYPATSPVPRQGIEAAMSAVEEFFADGLPELKLAVAREGFAYDGEPIATHLVVSLELANTLRDHGVAQITILPTTTIEDLLGFLSVVSRPPEEVRAEGGIGDAIAAAGVYSVHLTDVQLITTDSAGTGPFETDVPLVEISRDVTRLAKWFATISSSDKDAFRASLSEFVRVTGTEGADALAEVLADSLVSQPVDSRDALLALAIEPGGPAREIAAMMFGKMSAPDIATSILDGKFGRNMLALSSALTKLPLDSAVDSVHEELLGLLPEAGHSSTEAAFLDHMLEVRAGEPETALIEADRTFRTVVQAGSISEDDVARAREVTTATATVVDGIGIRTMLTLVDAQAEHDGYLEGAVELAAMVPNLIERGELKLVAHILNQLTIRGSRHPEWPDLPAEMEQALALVIHPDAMSAPLMRAAVEDRALVPIVGSILRFAGDSMYEAIAAEAIALKSDGLKVAEELLGRRLLDLLYVLGPRAQWFQLGPIVERFAADGSPRAIAAIESLMARPEERARQEVVTALAMAVTPATLPLLGKALSDPDHKVVAIAARAIAKHGAPGSAALIAARLGELDVDSTDFVLARELIGALARVPDPAADEALQHLSERRALIKRGHFAEVQRLVAQALDIRRQGGEPA